jgi:acyl dehydratase
MTAASALYPDTLELRVGPVTAVDLALFAAASGDHNPLHLDAEVARSAGFDQPLVHGMLTMACAGRLFTQRLGAGAVMKLQTRFTGTARKGDTLHLQARLRELSEGVADYELTGTTGKGALILSGSAWVQRVEFIAK